MNNSQENIINLYLKSTGGESNQITHIQFNDNKKLVSLIDTIDKQTDIYKPEKYEDFKKGLLLKIDKVNKVEEEYIKANSSIWNYIEENIPESSKVDIP